MIRDQLDRWKTAWTDAVAGVERESAAWTEANAGRLDWQIVGLVAVACVVVTLLEYIGGSGDWHAWETVVGWFRDDGDAWLKSIFRDETYGRLYRLTYWSLSTFVGYLLIPSLYVRFVMGERLRDFGWSLAGTLRHSWIYIVLFVAIVPAVFFASTTQSFQNTYPFYEHAARSWQEFLVWELLYALQFLSLEFFFRGFLIHGLKRRFGFYAILLSVVPYCMIHFGKPMPETLGAILAGLALGILSLFTRSIWLGVAIHVTVAVMMDVLSLWWQGKLF